jgi:uncharacterized membrane protein
LQHLNHAWRAIGRVFFAVLLAVYPVVIYFGLRVVPAGFFGLLLALLLLVRFGLLRFGERATVTPLIILLLYALLAIVFGQRMLLLYPVVANFTMALVFALSLWRGRPLLLRFAEARGMTMSAYSESYLYKLTAVWAVFLAANAGVALWTTTRSFEVWALYNGLLSYLLIACLLGGEVLFRGAYKRRMGIVDG